MPLSEREKLIQSAALTTETGQNEDMKYNINPFESSGLNPKFFKGYNTKIVNALNVAYDRAESARKYAADLYVKFANIILDTSNTYGRQKFEEMVELTDEDTLIEAIVNLANRMVSGEDITYNIIVNALGYVPARSSGADFVIGIVLDEPE